MPERQVYKTFIYDSTRWDGFELRPDDIIISTPPKCGTTWMQMIVAVLLFRSAELPDRLAVLSPWLDMNTRTRDDVHAELAAQQRRRFIKSHTPLDGLPWDPSVTYLHVARDPRDVALSWDNHMSNADLDRMLELRFGAVGADDLEELGITGPPPQPPEDPAERFWAWMEAPPSSTTTAGLPLLAQHVRSFWERRHEPNVHLFHYADLRADLAGQMARVAEAIGVAPPTSDLVEAAMFESMKARADTLAPNADQQLWQSNTQFFDRARSGDWRSIVDATDDGAARYERVLRGLVAEDLAGWLHGGWLGSDLATS